MSSQALVRELRASWAFIERNFNFTKRYWKWELVFCVHDSQLRNHGFHR